jgi:exopolysaccharide biosynthesis polyprenyl glycosylphosphotransferase
MEGAGVEGTSAGNIAICEVVLGQDVRASGVRRHQLLHRYYVRRTLSVALLIGLDLFAVYAAVVLAPHVWSVVGITVETPKWFEVAWGMLIVVGVSAVLRMYSLRAERSKLVHYARADLAILLVLGVVMLFTFNTITAQSAVYIWAVFVIVCGLLRWLYNLALRLTFGHTTPRRPVIVVGRPDHAARLAQLFATAPPATDLRIAGVIGRPAEDVLDGITCTETTARRADDPPAGSAAPVASGSAAPVVAGPPVRSLGTLNDLEAVVARTRPMEIVLSDPELIRDRMPQIVELCRRQRLTLRMAAPELEFDGAAVSYVPGFGMPVFVVRTSPGRRYEYELKRAFDVVVAALALLVLSPLFAILALAIKIESRGPVLYRSRRVGLGQRPFWCLKFRTMHAGADRRQADLEQHNEAQGVLFKIKDDPRVTRVGRFLRKTSLDELPQLINVVRGQMSLVGPRPLPMRDNELMEDWHKRRHVVLPGMTGLWQIGGRSDIAFDEMIELDFRYIETWSFSSDLAILARTAGVVVFGRGAY